MRTTIERFQADWGSLSRFYAIPQSPTRRKVLTDLCEQNLKILDKAYPAELEEQIDWHLFRNYLQKTVKHFEIDTTEDTQITPLLPFEIQIIEWQETRKNGCNPEKVAATMTAMTKQISALESGLHDLKAKGSVPAHVAWRASQRVDGLQRSLKDWYDYFAGYDPLFTWWVSEPFKALNQAMDRYGNDVREQLAGVPLNDEKTIVGYPIGKAALQAELSFEFIPYTPDELVAIAEREYAWCEAEMLKATKEMGLGTDWKAALEKVKEAHVEPGKQPAMIKELAEEAIAYVKSHKMLTVPPLAETTWRMDMMSPAAQLQSPFFLGGETIQVSYPTDTMSQEAKLMSMRGNNRYFARATVQHELIPGHHLQMFMNSRNHPYRRLFDTPFWVEGWALWWEMHLWDSGFARTPEEKVGMLFWRMHRCARIVFSLNYHLGNWTPQQCIDYLVEKVGHERANAEAEVRRSFMGGYGPLYQLAYMIGGLQIRSLHHDLVDSGKMTDMQFHDTILGGNVMPIAFVRARLLGKPLEKNHEFMWKF